MKRERNVKCEFMQRSDYNNTAGTQESEGTVAVRGLKGSTEWWTLLSGSELEREPGARECSS